MNWRRSEPLISSGVFGSHIVILATMRRFGADYQAARISNCSAI